MLEQKVIEVDVSLIFDKSTNQWQVSVAEDHIMVESIPGAEPGTVAGIVLHLNKDSSRIFKIGFAVDEVGIKPNMAIDLSQLNLLGGVGRVGTS